MTNLTDLPTELILSIAHQLDDLHSISALMRTSKKCVSSYMQNLLYSQATSRGCSSWCHYTAAAIRTDNLLAFKELVTRASTLGPIEDTGKSIFHYEFEDETLTGVHEAYRTWGDIQSEFCSKARLGTLLCFLYGHLSNIGEMIMFALENGMTLDEYNESGFANFDICTTNFFLVFPLVVARNDDATVELFRLFSEHDPFWTESSSFKYNLEQLMGLAAQKNYVNLARMLFEHHEEYFAKVLHIHEVDIGEEESDDESFDLFDESALPDWYYKAIGRGHADILEYLFSLKVPDSKLIQRCFNLAPSHPNSRCIDLLLQHGAEYTTTCMITAVHRYNSHPDEQLLQLFKNALLSWTPLAPQQRLDAIRIAAFSKTFTDVLFETLPDVLEGDFPNNADLMDDIFGSALFTFKEESTALTFLERYSYTHNDKLPSKQLICKFVDQGYATIIKKFVRPVFDSEEGKKGGMPKDMLIHQMADTPWICNNVAECLRALVQEGCDPNYRNGKGLTPLQRACVQPQADFLHALIDVGADVNVDIELFDGAYKVIGDEIEPGRRSPRKTPIELVIDSLPDDNTGVDCLKILLDAGAQVPESSGGSLLHDILCQRMDPDVKEIKHRAMVTAAVDMANAQPELAHQVVKCQSPCPGGNIVNCIIANATSRLRDIDVFLMAGCLLHHVRSPFTTSAYTPSFDGEKIDTFEALGTLVFKHRVDCTVKDNEGHTPLDLVQAALKKLDVDCDWDLLQMRLDENARKAEPCSPQRVVYEWINEVRRSM